MRKKGEGPQGGGRHRGARPCLCLAACLLLHGLSGCAGRELGDMTLVRTLGVDGGGAGLLEVTASSGVQSRGANRGDTPPLVFSRQGSTVSGACLAMQSYAAGTLFFGHVGQLLLGEHLPQAGVTETLDYVARDVELRLDTRLFVVRAGTAARAITLAAEAGGAGDQLEALGGHGSGAQGSIKRTVGDVLGDLTRNGCSFVPAVAVGQRGDRQELLPAGYGLLKAGAWTGWATGETARGVELLLGRVEADVLELPLLGGGQAALRVVGCRTEIRGVFQGDEVTGLAVRSSVEANLAQAPLAGLPPSELARLERVLERREQERLRLALELAQRTDTDFLDLGRTAGMAAPWRWAALQQQWPGRFSQLPLQIEVEAKLQRGYDFVLAEVH